MYLEMNLQVEVFQAENIFDLKKAINKFLMERQVELQNSCLSSTNDSYVCLLFYRTKGDGSMLIKDSQE